MSRQAKKLAGLQQLSQAAFMAAQSRMANLRNMEADIRRKITALDNEKSTVITASSSQDELAHHEIAKLNWSIWIDARRRDLIAELSRNLANQAAEREVLAVVYGKKEAMRHLVAKQKQTHKVRQQRAQLR